MAGFFGASPEISWCKYVRKATKMRIIFAFFVMLAAQTALAADWWVQPYGSASFLTDLKPDEAMTIVGEAGGGQTSLMPSPATGMGGGIVISAVPEGGKGTFGLDIEYISGSESGEAPLVDAELGAPTVSCSVTGLAFGGFFSGVVPWISGETYFGSLGGGLGVFRASQDTELNFRDRYTDPETQVVSIVDVAESASNSSTSIYLSLFLTEEFRVSNKFRFSATVGYRGVPSNSATITTESLTGEFKPEFMGPYIRVGLNIDI